MSIPEEEKHTKSPSGAESAVVKFLGRDGMHYPLPIPTPSLYDRRSAWVALYPGVTPPEQPFTLLLPTEFDFWTFVWGPNGNDFSKIRSCFTEGRIDVTWKYQQAVPGTKLDNKDPIDPAKLPERAHFLAIGPADRRCVENGELLLSSLKPINVDGIGRLWDDIRAWYFDCAMDRMTTLRSYLENVTQARKARALQPLPSLPPGFKEKQARNKEERKACEDAINAILDGNISGSMAAYSSLKEWVISRKEGVCLDVSERVNLAAVIWRERVETPEMEVKISGWVLAMKRAVQSKLLHESMRMRE
ncbi:hypothetical protein IL306_010519 [Fusarium sp. DS 682]|nr:hypothetical protein IL306_010519 [Fusarium sp. DS 682]